MFTRDQVKKAVHKLGQNAGSSSSSSSNDKELSQILRHAQHFLLQLGDNVASLSTAMECVTNTVLAENWVPSIQKSPRLGDTTNRSLDYAMQRVFSTLLRLHDGLILITSGECRHEADVLAARSAPFKSQLTRKTTDNENLRTNVYRSDGVYSGTGWDEWSDPRNGLQARLVRAAGRPWNSLSRGTTMEALLERLETEIRNVEDSFGRLKATVERALVPPLQKALRASNVKIRLTFQCKMEKMTVQAPAAKYGMEWRRLAGQFQLGESVLPQRISTEEWQRLLSIPIAPPASTSSATRAGAFAKNESRAHKRKRQCIMDDSDDEEQIEPAGLEKPLQPGTVTAAAAHEAAVSTVTSTGLVVQQKQTRKGDAAPCAGSQAVGNDRDGPGDSINCIKAALGVDTTELEVSHAALQEEEGAALDEARHIDSIEHVANVERAYKALRKELDRALRKGRPNQADDEDLIWDLRDAARLAAMEAGNHNLLRGGSDPGGRDSVERRMSLERALFFFEQALQLVEDQQRLHDNMTRRRPGEVEATSGLFQRNLLFLKGQAHVNSAIALVELIRLKPKSSWKNQATQQFDLALQSVESLHEQARLDDQSSIDAKIDEMKANELRLLVCRWRSTLHWMSGDRARAIQLFQTIASAELSVVDEAITSGECVEAALKVRIELYHWCVTLADLVVAALEAAAVSSIRRDASDYDSLLKVYDEAVEIAARQSVVLYSSVGQLESIWLQDGDILEENGILTEHELRQLLQETQAWWSAKEEQSLKPIHVDARQAGGRADHSALAAENSAMPANPPRRLVVYGSSTFPKKPRPRRRVLGDGNGNVSTTCRPPRPEPRKYRRWGDELLPQVLDENGRLVPKLVYPTLAPEMPPEIKELFVSLRLESAR